MIDRDRPRGAPHLLSEEDISEFHRMIKERYPHRLSDLLQGFPRDVQSLRIEWVDLAGVLPDIADDYFSAPNWVAHELDNALAEFPNPAGDSLKGAMVRVGGLTEAEHKRVSEITADDSGRFIALKADLSRISRPKHRYAVARFTCSDCSAPGQAQNTVDVAQPRGRSLEAPGSECPGCGKRSLWTIDDELSDKVDFHVAHLQDPPGSPGAGQPTISAYVEGSDLINRGGEHGIVDHTGESVIAYGQVVVDPDTALLGSGDAEPQRCFVVESIDFEDTTYTGDEEQYREEFEELAQREDVRELIRDSLAVQLHADERIELILDGAAMFLFGAPRIETDTTTVRGDVHMLMVGDPSTGKSTILRDVAKLSPRSRVVSGGSATAVGLTATTDHDETLGWYLDPGALPRSNGGHCIVDELDKATGDATGSLHDALEGDQRVIVDKASIHASLNTRCGLMAAANPEQGRFDKYALIGEQIDLDPALLSRFDLIFALADEVDHERDDRVVRSIVADASDRVPAVDHTVLRAWIAFARQRVHPTTLTDDAKEAIREFYHEVRGVNNRGANADGDAPIPVTPRIAEAAKRCAMASARMRLDETVTVEDVEHATRVLKRVVGDTAFDPETGTFNADRVGSDSTVVRDRQPKTQAGRRELILDLIREADEPMSEAEVAEVMQRDHSVHLNKTHTTIEELKRRGAIYQPESGRYRTT